MSYKQTHRIAIHRRIHASLCIMSISLSSFAFTSPCQATPQATKFKSPRWIASSLNLWLSAFKNSQSHSQWRHINTSLFSLGSVLHGFERNITQVLSHCMPWPSLVGSSPRRCRMNHTDRADRGLMNNCRSRPHQDGANGV